MAEMKPKSPRRAPAPPRPRRATITAADLEAMSTDQARAILADMPNLPTQLRVQGEEDLAGALERRAAPAPEPTSPAPAPPTKAAPVRAKDRRPGSRPTGSSRRGASSRRLARRVVRETPGLPGPSTTSLLLTFAGSTLAVVGLVLLLEGGPAFGRLPAAVGTFAGRLTDPNDPIF